MTDHTSLTQGSSTPSSKMCKFRVALVKDRLWRAYNEIHGFIYQQSWATGPTSKLPQTLYTVAWFECHTQPSCPPKWRKWLYRYGPLDRVEITDFLTPFVGSWMQDTAEYLQGELWMALVGSAPSPPSAKHLPASWRMADKSSPNQTGYLLYHRQRTARFCRKARRVLSKYFTRRDLANAVRSVRLASLEGRHRLWYGLAQDIPKLAMEYCQELRNEVLKYAP